MIRLINIRKYKKEGCRPLESVPPCSSVSSASSTEFNQLVTSDSWKIGPCGLVNKRLELNCSLSICLSMHTTTRSTTKNTVHGPRRTWRLKEQGYIWLPWPGQVTTSSQGTLPDTPGWVVGGDSGKRSSPTDSPTGSDSTAWRYCGRGSGETPARAWWPQSP